MSDFEEDEEISRRISQIEPCPIEELGSSSRWLTHHQSVVWLSLKAVRQTAQLREETVYSAFMASNKIAALVEDVITVEVWRLEILPHLLRDESATLSPLIVYAVLYHEGCLVTLLELMLYHSSACESLGDSLVDLIDYCHRTLSRSIAERDETESQDSLAKHPSLKHLEIGHLEGSIVIRCIAIVRFIAGHADSLSEIVTSRMLTTTDVPLMVVQLLEMKPWMRRKSDGTAFEIYDNGQWVPAPAGPTPAVLHPVAAHLWLTVLQLLMNSAAPRKYELDDFRCQQLLKLRGHLNQVILDQIPPLGHLEQWLVQLSLGGSAVVWQNQNRKKAFILEMVAEIHRKLMKETEERRDDILRRQRHLLSNESDDILRRLAVIYDPDKLEATFDVCASGPSRPDCGKSGGDPLMTICVHCSQRATMRCSRCRQQHYCSK